MDAGAEAALPALDLTVLREALARFVEDVTEEAMAAEDENRHSVAELEAMVRHLGVELAASRGRLAVLEGELMALRAGPETGEHLP